MTWRRVVVPLATTALTALLVLVTVLAARTSDATALGRARPVSPLPTTTVGTSTSAPPCVLDRGSGGTDDGAVTLTGVCRGVTAGTLACTDDDEVLNGSLQATLADGGTLTLTVVLPDGAEPGRRDDIALFAQVGRDGPAARWSTRDATGEVDATGTVQLTADLTAEPGTGTAGSVRLDGRLGCA